ncbi:outer membrane beta-barrel protein [Mucilaginibacter yixingensis]|uniref:outer membrane beta-barrel protein n=1 Tax=Mucilaginibacter yixingensis TaxID=1295612 RepID=UPI0014737F46|nr:outer membrane beta-barrel protein [Mucilaginibacter yixingensis]
MKKLVLLLSLLCCSVIVKAQYNYADWSVGFHVNSVKGYTDVSQNANTYSASAQLYYNFTPYIPLALDLQVGKLSGGNDITDLYHRYFTNNFTTLSVHGDLQLGEIVDYQNSFILGALRGFYLGAGFGLVRNNITSIRRFDKENPTYRFPGEDQSINTMLSVRMGYEVKIFNELDEPFMAVDLGYIHNITFGEGLDGYTDPPTKFKNNAPDQFRQITVGVKFFFGNPSSYVKPITAQ